MVKGSDAVLALVVLAVLPFPGCSPRANLDGCDVEAGGIEVIASRGPGAWERRGLSAELRELWRAGGLREGEELAYPVGAVVSPQGRLAIADFQLSEALVLEPDGSWLGAWGTPGQGPGEVATPVAANWDRRDGTLAVFDFARAHVVFLRDGESAREDVALDPAPLAPILASGAMSWAGVQPSGGVLLQPAPVVEPVDPGWFRSVILFLAPGAGGADTLAVNRSPPLGRAPPFASFAAPGWPQLVAAIGTDGVIALGGMDSRYRVLFLDEHARPFRVICRDSLPPPLTEHESRASPEFAGTGGWRAEMGRAPKPNSLAPFGRLVLGARGRLWVQRERSSPLWRGERLLGVAGASYDVFGADGGYLGQIEAPPQARLQAAAGDTVWAYEIGELDETWVVAYALQLSPD
ncbi:MAG: hypothetical protein ACE5HF_09775 [Gemmatimonadota bacterium]